MKSKKKLTKIMCGLTIAGASAFIFTACGEDPVIPHNIMDIKYTIDNESVVIDNYGALVYNYGEEIILTSADFNVSIEYDDDTVEEIDKTQFNIKIVNNLGEEVSLDGLSVGNYNVIISYIDNPEYKCQIPLVVKSSIVESPALKTAGKYENFDIINNGDNKLSIKSEYCGESINIAEAMDNYSNVDWDKFDITVDCYTGANNESVSYNRLEEIELVDAGVYYIKFTLKDKLLYSLDKDVDDVVFEYEITKKKLALPTIKDCETIEIDGGILYTKEFLPIDFDGGNFSGQLQTLEFNNFDNSVMEIVGDIECANAGEQKTFQIQIKDECAGNYYFDKDNSTSLINYVWEITPFRLTRPTIASDKNNILEYNKDSEVMLLEMAGRLCNFNSVIMSLSCDGGLSTIGKKLITINLVSSNTTFDGCNYAFEDGQNEGVEFVVNKAIIDVSALIELNYDEEYFDLVSGIYQATYDYNKLKTLSLNLISVDSSIYKNLPYNITLSGVEYYSLNGGVETKLSSINDCHNAGNFVVKPIFSYDETLVSLDTSNLVAYQFEILKADINASLASEDAILYVNYQYGKKINSIVIGGDDFVVGRTGAVFNNSLIVGNGDNATFGTFAWDNIDDSNIITSATTSSPNRYSVVFTPANDNYNSLAFNLPVYVRKAVFDIEDLSCSIAQTSTILDLTYDDGAFVADDYSDIVYNGQPYNWFLNYGGMDNNSANQFKLPNGITTNVVVTKKNGQSSLVINGAIVEAGEYVISVELIFGDNCNFRVNSSGSNSLTFGIEYSIEKAVFDIEDLSCSIAQTSTILDLTYDDGAFVADDYSDIVYNGQPYNWCLNYSGIGFNEYNNYNLPNGVVANFVLKNAIDDSVVLGDIATNAGCYYVDVTLSCSNDSSFKFDNANNNMSFRINFIINQAQIEEPENSVDLDQVFKSIYIDIAGRGQEPYAFDDFINSLTTLYTNSGVSIEVFDGYSVECTDGERTISSGDSGNFSFNINGFVVGQTYYFDVISGYDVVIHKSFVLKKSNIANICTITENGVDTKLNINEYMEEKTYNVGNSSESIKIKLGPSGKFTGNSDIYMDYDCNDTFEICLYVRLYDLSSTVSYEDIQLTTTPTYTVNDIQNISHISIYYLDASSNEISCLELKITHNN